jgi:GTPase
VASKSAHTAGLVAIIGRPNVGKSTLLNQLVGKKISITSSKPQTTRYSILGILTQTNTQYIFVDTPGFQTEHTGGLNRTLNRIVSASLSDVDAILWMVEALKYDERDKKLLKLLPKEVPVVLVINKIDEIANKSDLLPFIDTLSKEYEFKGIIPISAERAIQLDDVLSTLSTLLPQQAAIYEAGRVTDRSEEFLAAEIIREKLFRLLGDELPYSSSVVIETFKKEEKLTRIQATIYVAKASQKAIVIGKDGAKLKTIATQARKEIESLIGQKVFLETWVKVKKGWTDDPGAIRSLGFL